jgi:hypothetical protein
LKRLGSEFGITAETHMGKPKILRDVRWAVIACASLFVLRAAPTASQTSRTSAVPDISGVWVQDVQPALRPGWVDSSGKPFPKLPLTPWGEEQFKASRATHGDNMVASATSTEPIAKCLPPGVPAIYMFIFPMEIMEIPGRVVMFFEYGNYLRQIFTDGRKHQNLTPLWLGDSIGHWEGETLVVDANGFNDKTWIDNEGHPHSDALHVVERIKRIDHDHLSDEITVDDPKTYTQPLTTKRTFELQPGWNIAEFVCEDNNLFLDYEKKAGTEKK